MNTLSMIITFDTSNSAHWCVALLIFLLVAAWYALMSYLLENEDKYSSSDYFPFVPFAMTPFCVAGVAIIALLYNTAKVICNNL